MRTKYADTGSTLYTPGYKNTGGLLIVAASDTSEDIKRSADYVCDGTADDVQIQTSLDSLPAIGGTVLLADGTYALSNHISIDSNTILEGMGMYSTILKLDAMINKNMLVASFKTEITIRNLKLDGNKGAQDPSWLGEGGPGELLNNNIFMDSCTFVVVDSVSTYDSLNNLVLFVNDTHDCVVRNVVGNGADWHGIEFWRNVSGTIKRCVIDNCHVTECYRSPYVIEFASAEYCTISNCYGDNELLETDNRSIVFSVANNCKIIDNTILNGVIYLAYSTNCLIANNTVQAGGDIKGIYIDGYSSHNNIVGNYITGTGLGGGVIALNGNNNIVGNYFYNLSYGVDLLSEYNHVSGNYFETVSGVRLRGTAHNNYITSNTFNNTYHATNAESGAANNVIEHNYFFGQTGGRDPINTVDNADIIKDNTGWVTENGGAAASVADGGTIAHGLSVTPTYAIAIGTVAGEIVTITSIGASNITVAIKTNDGSVGTSQTIHWQAVYQP